MPTYEYECQKCGHHYDLYQSIKDPPKKKCPKCGGHVKRLIGTGAGLLFKGSGFYITDYRKPSYSEAAKKDSGTTTAAPAAKTEAATTPATKTPAAKPAEPKKKSKKE